MSGRMSEPVPVHRWKYDLLVALVLLPWIALSVTLFVQGITSWKTNAVEWAIWGLLLVYYVTSLQKTETGQRGGITVLEQPARETGPGWFFVPRFFAEIDWMPAYTSQDQFPADPEKVSKRDDDLGLLDDEFRPIRAMTAGESEEDGDDPLNTRLTLEVTFAVRWRLREGGFFDLYVKIPGRRWPEKLVAIRQQMRDTGETELIEEITERTPYRVNKDMHLLNDALKSELQTAVETWGIEIEEARMQAPDFPHKVNIALARIAEARANKVATETDAAGEKTRLTRIGEGEAAAMTVKAEARKREIAAEGEGLKLAADALGMTGADYRAGQVAIETIGEGDVILGAEGLVQVMGLGKKIVEAHKGSA